MELLRERLRSWARRKVRLGFVVDRCVEGLFFKRLRKVVRELV